jgi:site-specific DNA recombinase
VIDPVRPQPEEPAVRVATYTRISTDEEHQPYSLEAQAARLSAYIDSQPGWAPARTYTDSVSGATLERPGLRSALSEARAGRYDLLLVYRVDRLARSVRGLAQILEELDSAGVAFRSATEPFDTASPAGRMMVQMLGVFAEFERATIIDRVISGMERKAARGGWCGGREPYGYKLEGGALSVDTAEAAVVGVIFDLYVNGRMGTHAIAAWLNDAGHRTKAGRVWSYKAVLTVLRNHTYRGQVHFRGTWYEAMHAPIVEAEVFDAAQVVLTERGDDVSKRASNSSDYLLTGLVVCDRCRRHFTGTAAVGRHGVTYRYYTCAGRQRYGTKTCSADRLPADALDQAVLRALLDTYARTDLFARAAEAAAAAAGKGRRQREQELGSVTGEITKAEGALDRYLAAFEAGDLPQDACGKRVRQLNVRLAELRNRHQDLTDELEHDQIAPPSAGQLKALRAKIREAIDKGSPAAAKVLVQNLVQEIRVEDRANITPYFRLPDGGDPSLPGVRAPSRSVGRRGLEPLTPCASCKCATNCANGPVGGQATRSALPHGRPRPAPRRPSGPAAGRRWPRPAPRSPGPW